jgi:mono/diheme cytochrome c family protein
MRRNSLNRVITAGLALAGLVAVGSSVSAAGDAAKGEQVYTSQKCSMCHSIAGKGSKLSPLDGIGAKLSAEDIKAWIVDPAGMSKKAGSTKKPAMPSKYAKLPAADIDNLVAYLQTLK